MIWDYDTADSIEVIMLLTYLHDMGFDLFYFLLSYMLPISFLICSSWCSITLNPLFNLRLSQTSAAQRLRIVPEWSCSSLVLSCAFVEPCNSLARSCVYSLR